MRPCAPRSAIPGVALLALCAVAPAHAQGVALELAVDHMQPVPHASGHDNYYRVVEDQDGVYLRAHYQPPYHTMVRGLTIPEAARHGYGQLTWRWRALELPVGGNECVSGLGDSAAAVMAVWRRGLHNYVLKYVWSTDAPKGAVCAPSDGLFRSQRTIVLESGQPVNSWVAERVALEDDFRRYFASGDPHANIPDFVGVGVMSDGDQTHSVSSADYGAFAISPSP